MRSAIFGAGSLGTILGAFINRGGIQIDLINKNEKHIEKMKKDGATVIGTVNFTEKVNALLPSEMTGKYDIIFLMTKQLNNAEIAKSLLPFLNEDSVVVTFQNGIPEYELMEILGEKRVLGCTVAWGATLKEAGVSELTSAKDSLTFSLGCFGEKSDKFEIVKSMLEKMGEVEVNDNFIGVRWSKLLINSAFSGMSTVLGTTFGGVVDNKKGRLIAQKIIKECIDVAKADNVKIEPIQGKNVVKLLDYKSKFKQKISYFILKFAIEKHRSLVASMLQDIQKGNKCEVDAINGVVAQIGRKVNVPTPYTDKVIELIHLMEENKLKPSIKNIDYFF